MKDHDVKTITTLQSAIKIFSSLSVIQILLEHWLKRSLAVHNEIQGVSIKSIPYDSLANN